MESNILIVNNILLGQYNKYFLHTFREDIEKRDKENNRDTIIFNYMSVDYNIDKQSCIKIDVHPYDYELKQLFDSLVREDDGCIDYKVLERKLKIKNVIG